MRIDTHVHVSGSATLAQLASVAPSLGMTHYVAIMDRETLADLANDLGNIGARGIPFLWADATAGRAAMEAPVAGYKVHPRQTRMPDGGPFECTLENLRPACELAAETHRPLLFHTDGDEPNPNSVPMLAEVARAFPDTTIIAGHMGVYTQEFVAGQEYTPETWEPRVEALFRENLRLIADVPNLYGDITKFGMDFPPRTNNPMHRLDVFTQVVQSMAEADRAVLARKLVTGSDFPYFWNPDHPENAPLKGAECVAESHLAFQVECMERAFAGLFDEDTMVREFLSLLPAEFADGG